ncbi:hypothetical protein HU200_004194 [Digitaria exilis]|uniref:DUF1618 domain-containing protein n=1 Tax=Digitaria exilis TaxID=1010633 RepID=A0A835KTZ9_9POAL|nr:hypothetical protein HU200_004194 [Digitaria exilis]
MDEQARRSAAPAKAPPAISRFYLHMPTGAAETHCRILASHRDALLFSMYEAFADEPRFYDQELFVYIGGTPSLTLLPPCCTGSIMEEEEAYYASDNSSFTSDGVASWLASDDDDDACYDDDQQQPQEETGPLTGITQFELQAVGIYRHDDNYVVAYLCVSRCITPGSQAKDLEAQMRLYYSSDSRWELHALPISHHHHNARTYISDLTRWSCTKVITFGTYLCWIDYNCGILFWDVSAEVLQVTFLKLPVDAHLFPEACMDMYRNICVVQDQGNNKKMKFIDVRPYHGYYFRPPPNSSHFELNIWTLAIDGDDGNNNMMMSWVHELVIRDHDLVPSPHHGPLMFPVMSTEEPHIAYFMVRPYGYFVNKTWIVPLDLNGRSAKDAFLYLKGEEDLLGDDADTTRTNDHCFEPFLTCDVNLF